MADRLGSLSSLLAADRPVVVQTHDYPDIDAVASAWALSTLLRLRGFDASCVYRGELRSRSLAGLMKEFGIDLKPAPDGPSDLQIVVVDGSPANGNVTLDPSRLVGVIDHHIKTGETEAPYVDIRPEAAACSAMIRGYWVEADLAPPRDVATALLAGIQSDTDFLSRRCSDEDFEAYAALYRAGDWETASRIVRTVLDLRELGLIVSAIGRASVRDGLLVAFVEGPCGQETLAVLADLALRVEEISAAAVVLRAKDGAHFSLRSKSAEISAFDIVRSALEGIGSGGGHAHSAGGFVPSASDPGEETLRERLFRAATRKPRATAAAASRIQGREQGP
jgi:nanoRNase/pAp phosphatase (c-di-AMP/oligoRNAs hydrolase)